MKNTKADSQAGFGLIEFLVSTAILLVVASSVFGLISDVQRKTSYQPEVQSVLNNTRLAMHIVGRHIRQAGNDPLDTGLSGVTIISESAVKLQSDITGSAGPGDPDKGDPDGDVEDSGEAVTIRHNSSTRSLEIVTGSGSTQVVAGNISGLSFQYYDAAGSPALTGSDVRRIHVTISGSSPVPEPQTRTFFGIQLSSDFQVAG